MAAIASFAEKKINLFQYETDPGKKEQTVWKDGMLHFALECLLFPHIK